MSKDICFYHKSDFDGISSAAIVNLYSIKDCMLVGVEYSDLITLNYGQMVINDVSYHTSKYKNIYIVDFCFDKQIMLKLIDHYGDRLVLIDHHKDIVNDETYKSLRGLRSIDHAACYLTYKYLFIDHQNIELNDKSIPIAVGMLDLYDRYVKEDARWLDQILPLQYGLKIHNHTPEDKYFWDDLFINKIYDSYYSPDSLLGNIIEQGKIILKYKEIEEWELWKKIGYIYTYDFEVITAYFNFYSNELADKLLNDKSNPIDMVCMYQFNGNRWSYSLRSKTIDVGAIAKDNGGGGHPRAAGYTSKQFLYKTILPKYNNNL